MKLTPIIGLEVHVELKTQSKMFCSCSADYFGKEPNTHTCPVCLGLPGALPVPNKTALEWCIKIALALNCTIAPFSKFDRKNYFYPDLSKGYQISQYDLPIGAKGAMTLSTGKTIGITRVHMEEDTGKLTHSGSSSLVDFNRSGLPLVEIVTEPDFNDATEVKEYLQRLQQIVRYLDVSNADMEKGDMRLEPNISLSQNPKILPAYKVEVKNINSFRFVEKAIHFETKRQSDILAKGETPLQETRGWNEAKQHTFSQRVKEEANDYRYFPEPDIPPLRWEHAYIAEVKASLPELPDEKRERFIKDFSLTHYDAEILTRDIETAAYFEHAVAAGKAKKISPKQLANFIINKKPDLNSVSVDTMLSHITEATAVTEINETELQEIIQAVVNENEKAVTDFKNGKESVIMFLVGQVMRKAGKKLDAHMIKESLLSKLT
jgi:aspartyl-tRNA(Asn)/glutamyl-tRNA(Gln) amidotransferase subunit B